jgi:hypothetical protein
MVATNRSRASEDRQGKAKILPFCFYCTFQYDQWPCMPSINLCPYNIRISRLHSTKEEHLDDFAERGDDLLCFLKEILVGLAAQGSHNEEEKRVFNRQCARVFWSYNAGEKQMTTVPKP